MATGGQLVAGLCMCWDRYQEDEDTQKQETAQTDPNFTVEIDSSNATFRCFGKCRATMVSASSGFPFSGILNLRTSQCTPSSCMP